MTYVYALYAIFYIHCSLSSFYSDIERKGKDKKIIDVYKIDIISFNR